MTGAAFDFGPRRHPRRMSLTPMIDVVFLLLIFFMLSSRFGMDAVLPIETGMADDGAGWQGAPRLVEIAPDAVTLNGIPTAPEALVRALAPLMPPGGGPVVLRPVGGADLQALVTVMDHLRAGGIADLILID